MSNLSTHYSFNQPDVNLNGQIQNWTNIRPVYTTSNVTTIANVTTTAAVTTIGSYTLYTFNSSDSIKFSKDVSVEVLIVGGGGGGGYGHVNSSAGGGGGGGGSVGMGKLNFLSEQNYSITVGSGGAAGYSTYTNSNIRIASGNGQNSSITGMNVNETAYGGGSGGNAYFYTTVYKGGSGGSGGGGCGDISGGTGIDGSGSIVYYGEDGGAGATNAAGAGGGGASKKGNTSSYAYGGEGIKWSIDSNTYGGGGGGGSGNTGLRGLGGTGGGGHGGNGDDVLGRNKGNGGTANTGGGGGGGGAAGTGSASSGGAGGSGIVIIAVLTSDLTSTTQSQTIANWETIQSPVYDASLNGGAYISSQNYKTGNGSLEILKNTISTPPTTYSSITISSNNSSNIAFCISSDNLTLVYCGFNGGLVLYKTRNTVTDNWSADYTFKNSNPNTGGSPGFYSMAMTPNKTFIVFAEVGGYIYFTKNPVFNNVSNSNSYVKTLESNPKNYYSVAISKDGTRIVATDTSTIYYANWNDISMNYNKFTQTLESKQAVGQYVGISISSNKDRIVYGDTNGKWYLSYWNGSNYNAGSLIYSGAYPSRNSFFNNDASMLFLSYHSTNIQYFKNNYNTKSYDFVNTIPMGIYDCHGLFCMDSSSNMTIYSMGYMSTTIDYMNLSYDTTSTSHCTIKVPIVTIDGLSIACWFRSNYNLNNARIFDFATANTATADNIRLLINNNGLTLEIYNGSNNTFNITSGNVNDNSWNHVAITMSSSLITAYINSISIWNSNSGKYPKTIARPHCYLGKSNTLTDPQFFGNIDDFRTYNKVLTSSQIGDIYNNTNVKNNYMNGKIYSLYSNNSADNNPSITPNPSTNQVGSGQTYYYWNDPHATTLAINNSANPYNFYYTYTSLTSKNAKVHVVVNDVFTLKVNGQTNLLNGGNTFANPLIVPIINGDNLFQFLTCNKGGSAYFAAYVTDDATTPNKLFSTTSDMNGWNIEISGIYSNGYPISYLLQNNYTSSTAVTNGSYFKTNNIDLNVNYTKGQMVASTNTFLTNNNVDINTLLFS